MKRLNLKPEEVEAKLRECNGNMAAVARFFGCHRTNIWHFCKKRKALDAVATDIRESMKDNAESVLYREVLAGNLGAICFFLKCQAKDRGYVERQELDHSGGLRVEIVEELADGNDPGEEDSPPPRADAIPPE